MDAERDPGRVTRRRLGQLQHRPAAAVAEDRVSRVARLPVRAAAVRRALVDRVRYGLREEEVPGVDDVAAEVDADVDMHGPTRVPARVDRLEEGDAVAVRPLNTAQEAASRGALLREPRVRPARVAVPDVDRGAADRL